MVFAKISQVAHYAPDQVVSNDDLAEIMDTSDEWISSRTGILRRHISKDETTSDLATIVAQRLLAKANLDAEEIDFIVVATITPDSLMPSTAARVQANIDISSGMYRRGIVIGSETLSKVLDWSDRSTSVLFGDGAGGVLLEASDQKSFLAENLFTDGSRGASLESCYLGLSSPYSDEVSDRRYLTMDGRAVFDFAIRDVTKSIQKIIADASMEAEEIDYFLLHQANDRMLDKMSKKLGVSREKIPANMMEYGNTSAASIPILLSECVNGWKSKNSSNRIRWRFDMGHTSCYNLVKHVETHFKNLYIIF